MSSTPAPAPAPATHHRSEQPSLEARCLHILDKAETMNTVPRPKVPAVPVEAMDREPRRDEGLPYSPRRYPVIRNHIQCITAMLLALCTFTVIEISRGLLLSSSVNLETLLANYDSMEPLGDATHEFSWLCGATWLWLILTQLEGMLCALMADGACLLNTVALDWLAASSLAGIWLCTIVQHGQRLEAFWYASTIQPRTEWFVGCASYFAVAITGMLFLHATWTFQAALMAILHANVSIGDVAFHNVNDLADFGGALRLTESWEDMEEGEVMTPSEKLVAAL